EIDGHVGLAARVRLHIYVLGAEEFLSAIDGKILDDVYELASAVVAAPWISLSVFVRKYRPCRLKNSVVREVFRCDQFQTGRFAFLLVPNSGVNFRVQIAKRSRDAVHKYPLLLGAILAMRLNPEPASQIAFGRPR